MADANIKYQVDFEANTDGLTRSLSDAVARALGGGAGMKFNTGNANLSAIDAAIIGQGERLGIGSFYENVRQTHLGLDDLALQGLPQGSPVSQFALLAASSRYGYTPSTVQTMIRHAADMEAAQYDSKTDMAYKLDMEAAIGDLRRNQRKDRMAALAETYKSQGEMFAMAAANTTNPAEQRILLSRAASRYGSIASRTLMESGAVDPDTASLALSTSAELSALRSGIKPYNLDNDPEVIRQGITASIKSASQYASLAENAPEGSIKRKTMIALGKESLRDASVHDIAGAGFARDEMIKLAETVTTLNDKFTDLGKVISSDGGGYFSNTGKIAAMSAALVNFGYGTARDIMSGRTQWLSDVQNPYQTRRDIRQNWAIEYGSKARSFGAAAGATAGAALGTAILPGVGTVIGGLGGALVGSIPGGVAELWGQHNKDEKQIGDAYQRRAVDMLKLRGLYGAGVDYNYGQFVEGTGYASASSMYQLNQAADMLPGAMMFGAVGEQQMMALSYMPNYFAAMMEGRSTAEIAQAYKDDISNLPRSMQQYITSLLPGASEELRAFANSDAFGTAQANAGMYRGYDENQYGLAQGYNWARQAIANENVGAFNRNITSETLTASAPNYIRTPEEFEASMSFATVPDSVRIKQETAEAMREMMKMVGYRDIARDSKLGDIVINIDGETVLRQEYNLNDFRESTQTYIVGV